MKVENQEKRMDLSKVADEMLAALKTGVPVPAKSYTWSLLVFNPAGMVVYANSFNTEMEAITYMRYHHHEFTFPEFPAGLQDRGKWLLRQVLPK